MQNCTPQGLKVATSCLVFDSNKFEKIVLIERENEPEKGLWSFPGGKLDFGESIKDGMEREVFEETGYKIPIVEDVLYNIEELPEINYIIISGIAFINNNPPTNVGRSEKDLRIKIKTI